MKKFLFLLIFSFNIFYSHPIDARSCTSLGNDIRINFSTSYGKLSYDFTRNMDEISALSRKYGHKEHTFFAAGLALVTVQHQYSLGTKIFPSGKGYCVAPQNLDLFVGFSNPIIFVSNDLKEGTCRYELVLLHEQTHQRINIKTLEYFLPYFQRAAKKIMREMEPIKVKSRFEVQAATDRLTEEFDKKFNKILTVFKNELALEQSKLDSKSNYSFESKLCR